MSMPKPEWWDAVAPYLDQLLEKPEAQRTAWLTVLRSENPALAGHLERLLDEHRILSEERFLEGPPAVFPAAPQLAGETIGAYTLRAPIGEGGMATVWLADRTDGEIQQTVAVKFLDARGRRPGWRERFLKERQFLASLDHPAIVRIIDAGRTDAGQLFLVMEYVDGSPIDVFAAKLPLADCLALFLNVCEGVAHAHRRLIVHRDLKPSNILVNRAGQTKLLDFGIAKLLDDTGEATATLDRMLTPKYASPEQFRGAPQTTATDVYSLGAVLYKLVTGRSPHESDDGTIAPEDLLGGTKEIPAPRHWKADLPTDLDYILLKALRPEAEERYSSVDAFANDIRALLDSRPVDARSGNRLYRARKFVRRYRVPVAAALLVIVSLSTGLYAANRQRVIAERRFQQVRQLANQFFALDTKVQLLPGATDVRRQIVSVSIGYLEALGKEARDDRDLALEIASAYLQVARVQGVPSGSNLGDFDEADKTLARAEAIVDSLLKKDPRSRRALQLSGEISHDRMILANGGAPDQQLALARKTTNRIDTFVADGAATPEEIARAGTLLVNVALAYRNLSRYDDAIAAAQKAVDVSRRAETKDARRLRGRALTRMAELLRSTGHFERALSAVREAEPLVKNATYPSESQRVLAEGYLLSTEGVILGDAVGDRLSLNRPDEAIDRFQRAFDLMERLAAADPRDSQSRFREVSAGLALAAVLVPRDPQRALAVCALCLRRVRETQETPNRRLNEADCLLSSSRVLSQLGRARDARERLEAAFTLLAKNQLYPAATIKIGSGPDKALRTRAALEERSGEPQRAAATYQELLDKVASSASPDAILGHATLLSDLYAELGGLYRRIGRPDRAAAMETARVKIWRGWDLKLPNNAFVRGELEAATKSIARS